MGQHVMKENIIILTIASVIVLGVAYLAKRADETPERIAQRNWLIACIEDGKREDDCYALYNLKRRNGKL